MSDVVKLSYLDEHIAVVAMEDRESSNTFSHSLIEGLMEVFEAINKNPKAKVVVIHGYDNFFCCGGTKKELIGLHEQKGKFTDFLFYRALLDCDLPTISAMQGHAIGGGLAFGAFADIIILARECIYSTNFMKYGFTPGMGSTYIVPRKFGQILGREMLFSAKNYHGEQLKERGISAQVVPKKEVISTALTLAKELADKPLTSLKLLKETLVEKIKTELPKAIDREVAMHDISFKQPEVRERIEALFGN